MRWWWSVADADGGLRDVVVDAPADASWHAVAQALGLAPDEAGGASPSARAGDVAPPSGSVLGVPASPPEAAWWLWVRGGPLAGCRSVLPDRVVHVGRAPDNDLVIPDPTVSRHHLRVEPRPDGGRRVTGVAGAVVIVDGADVGAGGVDLTERSLIEIGGTVLGVRRGLPDPDDGSHAPDRAARRSPGGPEGRGPAAARAHRREHRVALPPVEVGRAVPSWAPWALAVVPTLLAVLLAVLTRRPAVLALGLTAPLAVAALGLFAARRPRPSGAVPAAPEAQVAAVTAGERDATWARLPDPGEIRDLCLGGAGGPWPRRIEDDDALHLRVGLADVEVPVVLVGGPRGGLTTISPSIAPVPVHVDLRSAGVVGVCGPDAAVAGLGRWWLLQLLALRGPCDLRVVLLAGEQACDQWGWALWAPHLRGEEPGGPALAIGSTDATREARASELATLVEARTAARASDRGAWFGSEVVLVLDGPARLPDLPQLRTVLRDGPAVGVFAVVLDPGGLRLADVARSTVVLARDEPGVGVLAGDTRQAHRRLLAEAVPVALAEECTRALARRHARGGDDALPTEVRLTELLRWDPDDDAALAQAWRRPAAPALHPVVGVGASGPITLDLAGHLVVAGDPGTGTTELLRALLTSLAAANRPTTVQFLVVDPVGDLASTVAGLPHVVALVEGIDRAEGERGLGALQVEVERRAAALRDQGVADVGAAWARDPATAARAGLAELVVVVDGAGSLRADAPEFVDGLVRLTRMGGHVGLHLVLAGLDSLTQLPHAWRDDPPPRVLLPLGDARMLAALSGLGPSGAPSPLVGGPGRALAIGTGAVVPFQVGQVSVRAAGRPDLVPRPVRAVDLRWPELGRPLPAPAPGPLDPSGTELAAFVAAAARAAAAMRIPTGPSPWPTPLPQRVTAADLTEHRPAAPGADASSGRVRGLVLGLVDAPEQPRPLPFTLRLDVAARIGVVGPRGSGRTSVLRVVAEAAATWPPLALRVVVLDLAGASSATEDWSGAPVRAGRAMREELPRLVGAGASPPTLVLVDGWDDAAPVDGWDPRDGVAELLGHAGDGVTVLVAGGAGLAESAAGAHLTRMWALEAGRLGRARVQGRDVQFAVADGAPVSQGRHR